MSSRRDQVIRLRVSKEELEMMKMMASSLGITVSEFVRRAVRMAVDNKAQNHESNGVEGDGQSVSQGATPVLDQDDMTTLAIADKLLLKLALHERELIRFDEIRAYLKTIKPSLYPLQEQNIVYLLQGLGILRPIGHVPLVTDNSRRVGLFRICISEQALYNGLASLVVKNNGHNNIYIQELHSYTQNDAGTKTWETAHP